ncbi:uncharacterized protein L3040_009361 [Drepanopeziza brunnea f. sp. 'multigermtubi']|uniref:Uncharacterized protein n=1 Tax=Marssonina brunnea f. sp. multigermtubi (strain MB_m1) TaxID=1072389 RepID=K1Y251_MARBU|nr:uncharacterized protein MBM_02436 [Drepanopeziza brunnea f. sp. 'multigermtubi' MB_m1]EKD19199.1 hypothetical protein MBM_02436 [Drepanopeziza brunnea f. sp. 'multigermtubi' MB_m1]KAJ5032769.1 hypothetical protein L3040_009361 [Drepanopeziza brunnea f. sp. 'multigermtubi']
MSSSSEMPYRRRSSQYSLFPICSPVPEDEMLEDPTPDTNVVGILKNHRSESPVWILANSAAPVVKTNDFQSTTNKNLPASSARAEKDPSHDMARLIPLRLKATLASPALDKPLPLLPARRKSPPPPAQKKSRPGSVTNLKLLPYTPREWSAVMEEVKGLYSKGQYKRCTMRCKQILEGIKDPYKIHPFYSIYLSFFAASSLEMTASTLPNHSSTKLLLYQESLALYQVALQFIEHASSSSDHNSDLASHQTAKCGHVRHSSVASISPSSISSVFSSASASSLFSTASSLPDSPTFNEEVMKRSYPPSSSFSSEEESECPGRRSSPRRRKKKVSFSLNLPTVSSESESAILRTIDIAFDESILLSSFPSPPPSAAAAEEQARDPTLMSRSPPPAETTSAPKTVPTSKSDHLPARPNSPYLSHLAADLKSQLEYHVSSIHAQISSLPKTDTHTETRQSLRADTASARYSRAAPGTKRSEDAGEGASSEKEKTEELRARIERLKRDGWQRKRFDGERYRKLCDRALEEVDGRADFG